MSKKVLVIIGLIIVVIVAVFVAVFGMSNDAAAPASTEANIPDGSANTQPLNVEPDSATTSQAATIVFTNDGFSPSQLSVKKGSTVTVKNESSDDVEFSSDDHPTHRLQPEMNLKVLAPGESASFTITQIGTWGFHDHIDDSKTGSLTVAE